MEYKKLIKEAVAASPPSPVLFELISAYEKLAEAQEKRDNADYYIELYGDEAKKVLGMLKGKAISRERVEKVWRGEWKHYIPPLGAGDVECRCTRCGRTPDVKTPFCAWCGAAMTDEAVQMVMERLEALE